MKPILITAALIIACATCCLGQSGLSIRSKLGPDFISDQYLEWDDRYDAITYTADSLCKRLDRMWVTGLITEEKRDQERALIIGMFYGQIPVRELTVLIGNEQLLAEGPMRRRLIIRRRNILKEIDRLEADALLSYGATRTLEESLHNPEPWQSREILPWISLNSVEVGGDYPEDFEEATNEFITSIMPLLPECTVQDVSLTVDTLETAWRKGLGYTLTAVINGQAIGVQELFPYTLSQDSAPPAYDLIAQGVLPGKKLLNEWLKESGSPLRLCGIQALDNARPTGHWSIIAAKASTAALLDRYALPGVLQVSIPTYTSFGVTKDRLAALREIKRSGLLASLSPSQRAAFQHQIVAYGLDKEGDYFAILATFLLQPCEWNFHPDQLDESEIQTYLSAVTLGKFSPSHISIEIDPGADEGIVVFQTSEQTYQYQGSLNQLHCGQEFGEFLANVLAAEQPDLRPVSLGPRRPEIYLHERQLQRLARHFPETFETNAPSHSY